MPSAWILEYASYVTWMVKWFCVQTISRTFGKEFMLVNEHRNEHSRQEINKTAIPLTVCCSLDVMMTEEGVFFSQLKLTLTNHHRIGGHCPCWRRWTCPTWSYHSGFQKLFLKSIVIDLLTLKLDWWDDYLSSSQWHSQVSLLLLTFFTGTLTFSN